MSMLGYSSDEDRQPLTWIRGYPIHTPTLLVIIHVVTMIATALAAGMGMEGLLTALAFSSTAVLNQFAVWQYVTYAFVNFPSIWFAIEMLLLFQFGREVEQYLGRRAFLLLYLLLLVLTPLMMTLLGLFSPTGAAGSGSLHFGIFIAFAAIYPNVAIFWSVTAKWIAFALVAINSLQLFAAQRLDALLALWASVAFAWLFVRYARGHLTLPEFRFWRRKPRFEVVRSSPPKARPESEEIDSIDPLLDKIAKHGMSSLTARERSKLERAREALMKKDAQ